MCTSRCCCNVTFELADYFSDTNTSTYAVPDTYPASGDPAPGEVGLRLTPSSGHHLQPSASSSFKPFGMSGSTPPLPHPVHPRDLYAASGDSGVGLGLQGCVGNSCYAVVDVAPLELGRWTREFDPPPVLDVHRDSLRFVEKLGEGPHGEVMTPSPPAFCKGKGKGVTLV